MIYENGVIWTETVSQPRCRPSPCRVTGLCNINDAGTYRYEQTRRVDLKGAFVVPGLIDNHSHFQWRLQPFQCVQLRQAKTPKEFIAILAAFCRQHPDDRWIQGGDWGP